MSTILFDSTSSIKLIASHYLTTSLHSPGQNTNGTFVPGHTVNGTFVPGVFVDGELGSFVGDTFV